MSTSRTPPVAGRLPPPGGRDLGERQRLVGDGDPAGGSVPQDGGQRLRSLRRGQRVVGVAEDASDRLRSTAEENSAESPDAPPRLTSRPPSAEHPRGRGGGGAEDRVDDDVGRAAGGLGELARPAASTSSVSATDRVGTGAQRPLRGGLADRHTATTRPAPSSARRADADLADRAAGAEHEHPLPRLQPRPPGQRHPGGHRRTARAPRPRRRATPSSSGDEVVVGDGAPLGQAAVAGRHPGRRWRTRPASRRAAARLSTTPTPCTPGHVGQRRAARSTTCRTRTAGRAARPARRSPGRRPAPGRAAGRGGRPADGGCPWGEDGGAHGSGGDVGVGQRECSIALP